MEEEKSLLERLRSGEQVICPKCGKAAIEPFGTTADKAYSFDCPECDFHAHWTPALNIE